MSQDAFISFMDHRYGNITEATRCAIQDMLSATENYYKKHTVTIDNQKYVCPHSTYNCNMNSI